MHQMAETRIVVATRFHNVVCALKMKKPTISIGYASKNDVLLAEMGLAEFFVFRLAATTGFLLLFTISRGELVWPGWQAGLLLLLAGTVDVTISRGLYYLALRRLKAEIEGEMAENVGNIARTEQSIGETRLQIVNEDAVRMDKIVAELAETRSELASVEERLNAQQDILERTLVVAPVSGVIVQKRFHTTGGVVGPGQPILDIVPLNAELLIDAQVRPVDIDVVAPELDSVRVSPAGAKVGDLVRVIVAANETLAGPPAVSATHTGGGTIDFVPGAYFWFAHGHHPDLDAIFVDRVVLIGAE